MIATTLFGQTSFHSDSPVTNRIVRERRLLDKSPQCPRPISLTQHPTDPTSQRLLLFGNRITITSGDLVEFAQQLLDSVGALVGLIVCLAGIACEVEEFDFASVLVFMDDEFPIAEP